MSLPILCPYAGTSGTRIDIGDVSLWFSYSILVAFRVGDNPIVMRENQWGVTTGKHMNAIDRNATRVSDDEFKSEFDHLFNFTLAGTKP